MVARAFAPVTFVGGIAIGTGVGNAVGGAIEPVVQDLKNRTWALQLTMPLAAVEAAQLVASGERDLAWGVNEASNVGVNPDRFAALVDMVDTAPDLSTLYDLAHRGLIGEAAFREGARKGTIEQEWLDALWAARVRRLSPAEAANAWQQGFMNETTAEEEAGRSGVPAGLSAIQRELAGLPPGAMDGLTMLRRGIIDPARYAQIVREGHTKTKYTDDLLALRSHILPGREVASLWLRGWMDEPEAKRLGALDGWEPAEMERLYQNRGRPATVRQAHIGMARGGRLPGFGNDERATLRRAVEQSNIRTEWFDILYAQRFTYPSAFVIRALASDGTFDQALTEQILIESGWKPEWAALAAAKWAGATAGTSEKWADRARSRLFTVAHNEFLDGSIDESQARSLLAAIGVLADEQSTIIGLWEAERGISRLELTPTQIRKAYKKALYDLPTALAELEERGMTPADADTFLQSG